MSDYLCISITFLDSRFHGRLATGIPEWPPSPLRLFQAILACTAPVQNGLSLIEDALRWWECLPPPILLAPNFSIGVPARIAIPNNDLDLVANAWVKGQKPKKQPSELKTLKTICPTHLIDGCTIRYIWQLPCQFSNEVDRYIKDLCHAASKIFRLGWGIDYVIGHGSIISDNDIQSLPGERWKPIEGIGCVSLRSPIKGTLSDLLRKHNDFLNRISSTGYQPILPLQSFKTVSYNNMNDPLSRPYVIFELRNDDGTYFRYPQSKLMHIAGMVRHLAKEAMKNSPPENVSEDWVETYVAGHTNPDDVEHRQFSYIPLPSIGHKYTDQAVRQVMIVAPLGDDRYLKYLSRRLEGVQLKPTPETRIDNPPVLVRVQSSNVSYYYTTPRNVWASVTPVILPGHDDHKPEKTIKLIEKSLAQAGLEQACEFEWRAISWFPHSLTAHKYDRERKPAGYLRPDHLLSQTAVHVKLRFKDNVKVKGPLSIGAGRHCGFGILAALD